MDTITDQGTVVFSFIRVDGRGNAESAHVCTNSQATAIYTSKGREFVQNWRKAFAKLEASGFSICE